MSVKETITAKLQAGLSPQHLDVVDDSARHAGHQFHAGGVEPRGETHFNVEVVSQAFEGKTRIERHRMVNTLLAEELAGPVHALAVKARAPGE